MPIESLSSQLSGGDLSSRTSRDAWNEQLKAAGLEGDLKTFSQAPYRSSATTYTDAGMPRLSLFEYRTPEEGGGKATQFTARRWNCTGEHNLRYQLHVTYGNRSHIIHAGQDLVIDAGNSVLIDMEETATFANPEGDYFCASIYLPDWLIETWLPNAQDFTGILLRADSHWGRALSAVAIAMASQAASGGQGAIPFHTVSEHICFLLSRMFPTSAVPEMGTYRSGVYARLMGTIQENAADPSLDLDYLSARHGMAKPTLYAAFAAAGTTFRTEVTRLRLGRARAILDNRRFDVKSVSEIAEQVGFVNAAHFATVFRKHFGVSPAQYRKIRQS